MYAASTSSVIHVPSWSARSFSLHALITCRNALLIVNVNASRLRRAFMLLLTLNSSGNNTNLGSGHHHMGISPSNHGKMPCLYASNNLSTDKSPPIASNPSDKASLTGGNQIFLSSTYNCMGGGTFKKVAQLRDK